MNNSTINIPEVFRAVVDRINTRLEARSPDPFTVHYDYGRYVEITRRLTQKGMGTTTKADRYPLIWLVMPFTEEYGRTDGNTLLRDVQIIIAVQTDVTSNTPARMADNFETRLYPTYRELVRAIEISGYFTEAVSGYTFPHQKTDQPYWGGSEGTAAMGANLFNDFIDAIQLKGIQLVLNEETCDRFKLIS